MNIKQIYSQENLTGAFLLMGKEKFLMESFISFVENRYFQPLSKDLNFDVLEGEEAEENKILEKLETLPFMGEKRVLLVKEVGLFVEKKKPNKSFLQAIFQGPPTSLLFFLEGESALKKTTGFYKAFKKANRVIDCQKLTHKELLTFIDKQCKKMGATMSLSDREFFIHRSQYENRSLDKNLYDIKNELDKLIALSHGEITRKDIVASMDETPGDTIFDLLASLSRNKLDLAMDIKKELLAKEEPVQRIAYMIIRQVRLLLSYKLLQEMNYSHDSIEKKLEIKSYEGKKIREQSHFFSIENLKEYYRYLIDLDQSLKTSSMEEEMALDILLLKMGHKKTENF